VSRSPSPGACPRPAHPGAWAVFAACAIGLLTVPAGAGPAEAAPDSLRVMTFNVMYEPARAGGGLEARWPLVVELLHEADADVIGFQEVMTGRVEPLQRALPGHRLAVSEEAGTGGWPSKTMILAIAGSLAAGALLIAWPLRRRPGLRLVALLAMGGAILVVLVSRLTLVGSIATLPERLAIAWRPERLQLVSTRTLWLSPTPERPGSHGRFDTGPHIAFAAVFVRIPQGDTLTVVNTHVGHSPLERVAAARVLRGWLDRRATGSAQLLLGDLNATPDNPLLRELGQVGADGASGLRDAWLEAPVREGPAETYHWSLPGREFFPLRIDYVLLRGPVRALEARVIGRTRGEAVASDHDALVVDLEL
jgi:endonuclease/exonuclease/phosphatase family metal-dependent hydrolase